MKTVIFILFLLFIAAIADNSFFLAHNCDWEDCDYKGEYVLEVEDIILRKTEFRRGSENFQLDSLHLLNPEKSYEELESKIVVYEEKYFY